jgi:Glycosyltransferase like family
MISIVVCSVNEEKFNLFSDSVQATIGVDFEIIRIDNSNNKTGICAAYNKGKAQCRYQIICFSHEDVLFKTQNWGQTLINIFQDKSIGLAGIFGACYISSFAEDPVNRNECIGQVIEWYKPDKPLISVSRFPSQHLAEVVGVDGVFMVTTANIISNIQFDEEILTGFHGYDFDLSLQISQQYKIVVTREILLEHASVGNYSTSYYEAIKKVSKKWQRRLPSYVGSYAIAEIKSLMAQSLQVYCNTCNNKKQYWKKHFFAIVYAIKHGFLREWLARKKNKAAVQLQ